VSDNTNRKFNRSRLLSVLAVSSFVVAAAGFFYARRQSDGAVLSSQLMWQEAVREDLEISVIERGNLESQENEQILCGVEDVQRDGINGTPIQWIIPNGSSVQAGDLLVELEASPMRERLDEQILEVEESRSSTIQAQSNYDNQIVQNETAEAEARLQVKLAKLDLEMFTDPDSGTYKLSVEAIERTIEDVNNEILAAKAALELQADDRRGIESLFRLGYANRNELRRSELSYMQAEGKYAATLNKLQTQYASMEKAKNYERKMELLTLEGKLQTAEKNLEQVVRNNQAQMDQATAVLKARTESLKKDEERLARYEAQLEACKIYSPRAGMIAYATDRNDEIREGVPVRYRQHILSLPSLSKMQVRTSIHESVLDQIDTGLKASITVDAFPDRSYEGTVQSIAVLPDQNGWRGSDTKVYDTVVTIDTEVNQIKPGMTAVCEIQIDTLENVVLVPIQSIVQRDEQTMVITRQGDRAVIQNVTLGRSNDTRVQILEGLEAGQQVALNPAVVVDQLLKEAAAA